MFFFSLFFDNVLFQKNENSQKHPRASKTMSDTGIFVSLVAGSTIQNTHQIVLEHNDVMSMQPRRQRQAHNMISFPQTVDNIVRFPRGTIDALENVYLCLNMPEAEHYKPMACLRLIRKITVSLTTGLPLLTMTGEYLRARHELYQENPTNVIKLPICTLLGSIPLVRFGPTEDLLIHVELKSISTVIDGLSSPAEEPTWCMMANQLVMDQPDRERIRSQHHTTFVNQISSVGVRIPEECNDTWQSFTLPSDILTTDMTIHITKENGDDFSVPVCGGVRLCLNDNVFHDTPSFVTSRIFPKDYLGVDVTNSNLHYIPFYSFAQKMRARALFGPARDIIPFGASFSNVSSVRVHLLCKTNEACKVNVFMRQSNILSTQSPGDISLFYLRWAQESVEWDGGVTSVYVPVPVEYVHMQPSGQYVPPAIEQHILTPFSIPSGSTCIISYDDIVDGDFIDVCEQCHQFAKTDIANEWFALKSSCPMCRTTVLTRHTYPAKITDM